mmetsp:Transcript_91585/g.264141  ORF Transcript_91585/g.264141 Transcript_91585/m.264141 type:complete len:276 (+) Transcript_91585:84-911(+)
MAPAAVRPAIALSLVAVLGVLDGALADLPWGKITKTIKKAGELKAGDIHKAVKDLKDAKGDIQSAAEAVIKAGEKAGNATASGEDLQQVAKDMTEKVKAEAQKDLKHSGAGSGISLPKDMVDAVKDVPNRAAEVASEAANAAKHGTFTGEGAADRIAKGFNRTALDAAKAIEHHAPQAAKVIQRSGARPSKGATPDIDEDLSGDDVAEPGDFSVGVPLVGVVFAAICGYVAYRQFKVQSNARSPGLLAEPDMGMQMRGGDSRLSAPGDEPYFTQF